MTPVKGKIFWAVVISRCRAGLELVKGRVEPTP